MRITKPEWLRHDADKKKLTAIFSLDFHPSGTRLATAGMDNKIRIWSTRSITHPREGEEEDEEEPRLLSTLTSHSGAVMCVRFSSGDGRYLASGADDMIVLIWERDADDSQPMGNISSLGASAEVWRPVRRLTGHESDVCDLAWSPDNRWLATCGLDNAVYIWDGATFERVKKLTGHSQFVKGLTFDPAGKYLATQSDDKTLKIWRTSDWALQTTVSKPYEDNIFSTYFRRPSWSPDGECIATANAANGKVPVAAIVSRDTWKADLSFVGHRAAIEAVRFNPRVFSVPASATAPADGDGAAGHAEECEPGTENGGGGAAEKEDGEQKKAADPVQASICAAGGQDRGITVWLTSQHMPIAAATNLFTGNLLDLAWHTFEVPEPAADDDSESIVACLAACSYDGTVALLEFTKQELGLPAPIEDQEAMLAKHGWIRRSGGAGLLAKRRRGAGLAVIDDSDDESDAFGADGMSLSKKPRPIAETVAQLLLEEQGAVTGKVTQGSQIEQTTSEPLLPPLNTTTAAAAAAAAAVVVTDQQPTTSTTTTATAITAMPVPVRTKSGKKRVAPLFVRPLGGSAPPPAAQQPGTLAPAQPAQLQAPSGNAVAGQQIIAVPANLSGDARQPIDAPIWIEARVLGTRHMQAKNTASGGRESNSGLLQQHHSATVVTQPTAPLGPQTLIHAQSISAARVHLSVPKVVAMLSRMLTTTAAAAAHDRANRGIGKVVLAAYNHLKKSDKKGRTRLVCSRPAATSESAGAGQKEQVWVKYFSCPVVLLSCSEKYTAVCLRDGSMHWFDSQSGARLLPALMREAHPAHLVCMGSFCLLLDAVGQLAVWNLDTLTAVVENVSVAPLLYSAELVCADSEDSEADEDAAQSEEKAAAAANGADEALKQQDTVQQQSQPKRKDKLKDKSKPSAGASKTAKEEDGGAGANTDDSMVRAPRRHKPMVAVTSVDVAPATGAPILSLSDGRSFVYHLSLKSWLRIGDPADFQGSDFSVLPQPTILYRAPDNADADADISKEGRRELAAIKRTTRSPLAYLQEVGAYQYQRTCDVNRWPKDMLAAGMPSAEVKRSVTLDHLEHQVGAAGLLGSDEEVVRWADILARHLARSGDAERVARWLADLLGPPLAEGLGLHTAKDKKGPSLVWNPAIAGVPKRQLLERLLPILATNRRLQSVVTEYSTALSKLVAPSSAEGDMSIDS
ncbi:WD40 repeat-like protein [Martensiomyces pterosporus]|nr:WD40 repeat-like protein [Martensiomyces pterosporus]